MYEAQDKSRDGKKEGQIVSHEGIIGYDGGHYVLVGRQEGMEEHVLVAGDVLEFDASGRRQAVHVASGGYRGWYYITADGQQARFVLCMQACLLARPT